MKGRHTYLLFGVAAILAFVALSALPFVYKPTALDWEFYDPTFVYVLKETPEALGRKSCQPNTVMAFGSSPLDTAIARRGEDWRRRAEWRRYDGPLDDIQNVSTIVRTREADLRMFYPVLSQLPDCKKVVAISADILLTEYLRDEGVWEELRTLVIDSPIYYYRALVERLWSAPYRISFDEGIGRIFRVKQPYNKEKFASGYRWRGKFRELVPEHQDIILELVENNAQVVILDIDRDKEWEIGGAREQENFRRVLQSFAASHESIHYRHFPSIDSQYYLDFAHMNYRGADIFRPWLASETASIARDTDGFQ